MADGISFNVNIEDAKRNFFDRDKVKRVIGEANAKYMERGGGKVRLTAQRSIQAPKQLSADQLTKEQKSSHAIALHYWKKAGGSSSGRRPKRPRASSRPGEPPRSQTGLLKKWILNTFDERTETAVIGPAKLNSTSGAPATLEYGGTTEVRGERKHIQPRPYMQPALEKIAPQLPGLWRDLIKF